MGCCCSIFVYSDCVSEDPDTKGRKLGMNWFEQFNLLKESNLVEINIEYLGYSDTIK